MLVLLLLSSIFSVAVSNPTCGSWCHREQRRYVSYNWGNPCCGGCEPYTKENPLPVVLVNQSIKVDIEKNPCCSTDKPSTSTTVVPPVEYTCPVDSPFRPCFRIDPIECKTDADCRRLYENITIKCCPDFCYEGSLVCKPGIALK